MLDEGQRRAERGTDVVVGLVETHGRAKTKAAIGGLEVLPRRKVNHGGLLGRRARSRRPCWPGGPRSRWSTSWPTPTSPAVRHEKRWQDVEDLLAAGIDVITTVNIQHLESLNDVVDLDHRCPAARDRARPVVRAADAIELVDMSPQALRRRLAHGNVYPADKVDAALSQLLPGGQSAALRELALLWLADRVDDGLEQYRGSTASRGSWPTRERVVVGVSGGTGVRGADAPALPGSPPAPRAGSGWPSLSRPRRTRPGCARPVGAAAGRGRGAWAAASRSSVADDSADGLLDFAREINASQVLIGASRRGRGVHPAAARRGRRGDRPVRGDRRPHGDPRLRPDAPGRSRRTSGVSVHRLIAGYALALVGPASWRGCCVTPDVHSLPSSRC